MAMMDLPVETIACILGLTTPRDAKRMAAINKTFLEASRSDLVWQNFLPPHWEDLFQTSPPSLMQVYDQLCEGVYEQGDAEKIYTIDRPTGFLTRFLGVESLTVVWGDTPEYWEWIEGKSTRVKKVARLRNVCWLEIRGMFKGWWSPGKYSVAFSLQLEKWVPFSGPMFYRRRYRRSYPYPRRLYHFPMEHSPILVEQVEDGPQAPFHRSYTRRLTLPSQIPIEQSPIQAPQALSEDEAEVFQDARQDLRDELEEEAGVETASDEMETGVEAVLTSDAFAQRHNVESLTFGAFAHQRSYLLNPFGNYEATYGNQVAMDEPESDQGGNVAVGGDQGGRYQDQGGHQSAGHPGGDQGQGGHQSAGDQRGHQSGGDQGRDQDETDEDFEDVSCTVWKWAPVKFKLVVDGIIKESSAYLCASRREVPGWSLAPTRKAENSWVEFEIGQFVAENGDCTCELEEFSMMGTDGAWKRGLIVEGLIIRQIA